MGIISKLKAKTRPAQGEPAPAPQPAAKPAAKPAAAPMASASAASAAVAASLASGGVESVGFLNDIVAQLWDYINVAGSAMTKEIVEPMFKDMLPGPLSSLHFEKIDLGKVPIKFDNIDVHNRSEDVIKLDVDVFWDGECDIQLAANLIGSFGVRGVKLAGRMSILLCPLVDRLPLVTALQVAFVNPPKLELDFTGTANLADCSLIDNTIRKIIHQVLASIVVLPNRLLVKIDPANEWYKTYQQQMGILRLTVVNGSGFKVPKQWIKDIPDVYCNVNLGALDVWQTSTKNNDVTPEWNETKDFLLSDHDQKIFIEAMDDDLVGDDKLGKNFITVGKLLLEGKSAAVPLCIDESETGAKIGIKCEVYQFVSDVASFTAEQNCGKDLLCGLVTILIAGAHNIPGKKEEAFAGIKVTFIDKEFQTPCIADMPGIDALNPCYDSVFRVPLTAEMAANPSDFCITLVNNKEKVGSVNVKYSDVLAAPDLCLTQKYDVGEGASIDVSINVRGIKLAE